jgi:Co/Zn/Cd efflux system component
MQDIEDGKGRRNLRLAVFFAVLIFSLAVAVAQVVFRSSSSRVFFIVIGAAGLVLNVVVWILLSKKACEHGQRLRGGNLSFIAASFASAISIAYGCGESHFSQYAGFIVISCVLASCLIKVFSRNAG